MSLSQVSDCMDHIFLLIQVSKAQSLRVLELRVAFICLLEGRGGGISVVLEETIESLTLKGQAFFHAWLTHLLD